ncbi:MAG TPA: UPF0182 family protein, partial [Pyrinomonadaceae bacterium]|nr:UPF0182 family protein [Pyrinomonadaceae bacterium]
MSERQRPFAPDDFDGQVIDIDPSGEPVRRKRGRWWLVGALVALLFALSRAASIYLETLWFGSLGYTQVYWTTFKYELALFAVFAVSTTVILRVAFWLIERAFDVKGFAPRRILVNNQPVFIQPARLLKPLAWVAAVLVGLFYGLAVSSEWQQFALWLNRPQTADVDPVFGKQVGFYLFTLPVAEKLAGWFLFLAVVVFV